ncbi:hypothetical protein KI387_044045 [Taxus chinensis]|uniref:Uncharacterized protein n=1 Tax=Taxus chinensis TaxID=29808 RepID=A0AA38FYU9_TAXCH|nr:hypothetical protein KI387_044045 [Taxus chinensis]
MVDAMGATEVADVAVITGIGPNYETTGGEVDVGSTEPDGADAGVGARVGGIDTDMPYIN